MRRFLGTISAKPLIVARRPGKVRQLQSELDELQRTLAAHHDELSNAHESLSAESHSHAECQNQLRELRNASEEHQEALASRDSEILVLHQSLREEESRSTSFKRRLSQMESVAEHHAASLQELEEKRLELEIMTRQNEELSRENLQLRGELEVSQQALGALRAEHQSNVARLEDEIRKLQQELNAPQPQEFMPTTEVISVSRAFASAKRKARRVDHPQANSYDAELHQEKDMQEDRLPRKPRRGPGIDPAHLTAEKADPRQKQQLMEDAPVLDHMHTKASAPWHASGEELHAEHACYPAEIQGWCCPAGHLLVQFKTAKDNYRCDNCSSRFPAGTTLYGCRQCDYDECSKCLRSQKARDLLPDGIGHGELRFRELFVDRLESFARGSAQTPEQAGPQEAALQAATRHYPSQCRKTNIQTLSPADLEQLSGDFRTCIGSGSFGQVFAGRVSRGCLHGFSGNVAVKLAHNKAANLQKQFWREVRVGEFRDEHLMPLLAVCLERFALVYPRAQGVLEDRLRAPERPAPLEGLSMLLGAARGLLALHSRGFIHRDVKSANILYFDNGSGCESRLGDYGLAREVPERSPDGFAPLATFVGTSPYVDPEVITSGQGCCSTRSDMFSFGVVMLEVLLRRSVTECSSDARPIWCQFNEAIAPLQQAVRWTCSVCDEVNKKSRTHCNACGARGPANLQEVQAAPLDRALAFVHSAGAGVGWNPQALEIFVDLVMSALRESKTQPGVVERPDAASVVECLEQVEAAQKRPATPEDSAPRTPRMCTICFEEEIDARLQPCRHALACRVCAQMFIQKECPVCRCLVETFDVGDFPHTFDKGSPGE